MILKASLFKVVMNARAFSAIFVENLLPGIVMQEYRMTAER
jgi:hypothetical protein